MEKEITLTTETFKALAGQKRVQILKELGKRRKTQSELAQKIGVSAPTISEHLGLLEKAGLVHAIDEGRKWKYYSLTQKGKEILHPGESRILVLLGTSLIAFLGVAGLLFGRFSGFLSPLKTQAINRVFSSPSPLGVSPASVPPAFDVPPVVPSGGEVLPGVTDAITSILPPGSEELVRGAEESLCQTTQDMLGQEVSNNLGEQCVQGGLIQTIPQGFQGFTIFELSLLIIVAMVFGLLIGYYWHYKQPKGYRHL
ncbi:winged helix-turn-helix domain-containing protein [Candidatus Micrarchaeota archaeon]|nr:winged helix-turn-helix domain-containing protein [Candidatus Micrarchaeota archaeon]MBU1930815.1 winged helix-turn-helix domain-containing protein [Candidatus Micrarchaeota archaeon]